MKHAITLISFLSFFCKVSFAQSIKIFGYVKDSLSGETLIGANIYDRTHQKGCVTNNYGFFSLEIPNQETTKIDISFVGYQSHQMTITPLKDTSINLLLATDNTLKTLEVVESKSREISHGVISIPIDRLKSLPSLAGETDLLKALSFLPGISTGSEGSSALYVRGGTPDQNLILLDDATVYNTSHLFGFLSILNPNAVKSMNVYKGGFPARYGGRLSSVIDVTMKEGNNQKRETEANIGIISSSFITEGPFQKGKSSYMISGRSAYLNLLTLPRYFSYLKSNANKYNNIYMYDLNVKVNFELPKQQKLFLSGYLGNDYLQNWQRESDQDNRFSLQWGNKTATLRYTNIIKPNFFMNATLNYNEFAFNTSIKNLIDSSKTKIFTLEKNASVRDLVAKTSFDWYQSKQNIKFGMEAGQHYFLPNKLDFSSVDSTSYFNKQGYTNILKPQTIAFFIEDALKVNSFFNANIGVRWLNYLIDNQHFSSIEPRLMLSFVLNQRNRVDASLTQMGQYLHLLSTSTGALGNDIWVPATEGAPLEHSQQAALSYSYKNEKSDWSLQLEGFYKTSKGLIDYRQGVNLFNFDKNWEQVIEKNGTGRAYGAELLLKKEGKNWNGWISYTLARSEQHFDNINKGAWYPQRYDRRHNLAIVFEKPLGSKWTFNSNFVFQTGSTFTLPEAVYRNDVGSITAFYQSRNNARMPNYHRLDISFTKNYTTHRGREAKWNFSVYNAYGRKNAYVVNYTLDNNLYINGNFIDGYKSHFQAETLFRFVPGVSWSVKF